MKSIKAKLILVILSILLIFAAALFLANTFFLDDYYVYKTKNSFESISISVQQKYREDKSNILNTIQELHNETGYKIQIADASFNILYSSAPEFDDNTQSSLGQNMVEIIDNTVINSERNSYYNKYENIEESFVLLAAKLNKEDYIIITQPLSQIVNNAQISNDFLLIIGILMFAAASGIAAVFARRMIKPILEIKNIADAIAELDFSEEYIGNNQDEIGELGSSINSISNKLSSTINELKDNNEQLINEMTLQKRFIASVSHEFNTPVGLIRGYTEALQMHMYTSEQEKEDIINIIIKEADRLNHLVNDILLLMKLDSKSFTMHRENMDIIKLINNRIDKIDIKAKEKAISLNNLKAKDIYINADSMRITQVVDNLLSNAIIHTPNKGTIVIKHELNNEKIKIYIYNSGSHIENKDAAHLFDPFYRSQDARSRKKGGSGLCLSIVAGIVTAHGGDYGAGNTNDGVKFFFTLPIK